MEYENNTENINENHNKKGVGILLGGFFSLIGLLIGILLYEKNEEEKSTFIKGWIVGFVISIVVGVIFGIIVYINAMNAVDSYYNELEKYLTLLIK